MKLFTLWRITLLSALFSLLGVGSAWAQLTELEVGGVYHFTNVGYPDKAMGATNPQSVGGVAKDDTNKAQLWYVESENDNGYALRNLGFGTYLQANGQSTRWTLASTTDSDNSWIKLETKDSNNAFKGYTYGNYGYAHIDGSSNVVGWETGATATQWTITKKVMTSAEIEEALNIFTSVPTIQEYFDNLFSDKSCTTLKGTFDENDASFKELPPTLQAMVRKVAGNASWEETNFTPSKAKWDAEYAKKYRVQLYEPYNEPECAAAALGVNAHTNLNNPTGIFANNGDIVYVMVESEIKAGSSLYLTYHIGHGELSGYANGWELHQGLNVIPVYNDETNFCINYVVHTFDTSNGKKGNKAKARKLSDYDPIKIHIEGGHINGYWNKVGDELYAADNNDTWNYLKARATQKTVTVLGKYITLQFPLLDEHTVDTDGKTNKGLATYFNDLVKIEDCINEWDNVMLWERLLLGVLGKSTINAEAKQSPYSDKATVFEYTGNDGEFESDYSDYYNVHGLSYGIPNSYMYGGWAHCGYNFNTMEGIIQNLPTNAGSHWGPGHEIGHQHQALLTVNGLTEVTNNLFANVVLWYYGETTSRYNGSEGALSNVLAQFNAEGTDFFSNNIWAQTIMYYKLFLYYHVLGHNPKFYPRLFEMLRQDPMSTGYTQDGSKCLMHFYKKCCLAAEEDLTEFFRAHGFFEVMDNRFVGDYSNSVYNLTQAQIDAAIAEVKAKKYSENIAVLFITDATGEGNIKSNRGDDVYLTHFDTNNSVNLISGELGNYATFNTVTTPSYNYAISGNTVTMEGSGGVGFAILNENGELIGFSDKKTFEISAEAVAAIASGEASIVTLKADNTPVAATNVMDTGNTEEKYALLGELLGNAKQLLDLSDETGIKVGYYRASSLTNLQEAYESAKAVYDAQTIATYSAVYDVLYQEYANLLNNDYARINITEGYAYRLTNKAYSGRSMAVNTENNQMSGIETAESDAQLWYFEAGATPGTYYLKNKATSLYPGDVSTGAVLNADKSDKTTDNGAHAYHLQNMGNGLFALVGKTGLHCASSQDYNIVGWGADADATQWYITAEVVDKTLEARLKLEETIAKTEALVNEMAEVKIKGSALDLTTCTITSNTPETGHETKYLVDGNPETFFHTNWAGTAISENHNFIIDLGEGNSLEQFAFNYITLPTSAYNVDAPKTMVIEGSTNGTDYTSITTLSGLPTTKGATYASTTLGTKGAAYRYLRFSVTDATGGKLGNYYYFGLAEFGLTNMQTELLSVKDGYSSSQTAILDACDGLYSANLVYNNETATQAELQTAASALNAYYEALLKAYNDVKDAGLDAKKTELQALISNTTKLIGQCGTVTYTPATFNGEAPLQTTNTTGDFYVSTNADQNTGGGGKDGDGIAALVDNKESTYFHTRWGGDVVNEPHYFQVDLGEELSTNNFTFSYKPRNGSPAPTAMKVYGSNDGTTFTDVLATITEGLPAHNSGNTYSSSAITPAKSYRYLRFTVTESVGPGNEQYGGQYFFGMLEFDLNLIGSPESYTVQMNQGISNDTEDLLIATYKENQEAQSAYDYATTEAQVEKAIANLQAQYKALEDALNDMVDKKAELQALIDQTNALVEACATVKTIEAKTLTLNTSAAPYKLSDSHGKNEGSLDNLLDGNTGTFYVSNWNVAATVASYLQVDLGTGNELEELIFTFTNRPSGNAPTPTEIVVSASADGNTFTDLATFTQSEHNLPPAANKQNITATPWTSPTIQATSACRYWRFTVTKSHRNDPLPTNAHFGISEFGVQQTADEQAALKFVSAEVTGEMVVNAYRQAIEAGNILANPTSIAQLEQAIAELQEQYNTLYAAKQDALQSAKQAAQNFLNATANKVGYPAQEAQTALQTVITESSDINAINTALQTYKESSDIIMPTSDKVYTLKVRYIGAGREGHKYMNVTADKTFSLETVGNEALPETAYFICRKDANTGRYYFVPTQGGGYLSYQGVTATHLAETCAWEVKPLTQCNKTHISDATAANLLGYFGIRIDKCGANSTQDWYFIVNESSNGFSNSSAPYLNGSYTSAILIEEVSGYTLNKVNLTATSTAKDKLLKGIADQQTISTFSAPYATVIPEGVTAYYASQEYNGNMLYLKAIEEGLALPANEGVILVGNADVMARDFVPATTETVAEINNKFSNSAAASVVMENNDYILANGNEGIGIYKAQAGTRLKQGKAFLRMGSTSNAPSFIMNFGGNATGVEITLTDGATGEQVVYDLYGRRVTEVTKGRLYIVNGKKVFIK